MSSPKDKIPTGLDNPDQKSGKSINYSQDLNSDQEIKPGTPTSAFKSIPIRHPKNSARAGDSVLYQQATQNLSEIPSSFPSSFSPQNTSKWSIPSDKVASQGLPNYQSDQAQNLPSNSARPGTPDSLDESSGRFSPVLRKGRVTFNSAIEDLSTSDVSSGFDISKRQAAKLLKRHLITKNPSQRSKRALASKQIPPYERDSADISKLNSSLLSYRSSKQKIPFPNNSTIPDTNDANSSSLITSDAFHDSEGEEYDKLLDGNDSDDAESLNSHSGSDDSSNELNRSLINPLTLPSGDITHSLYKWQRSASKNTSVKRAQSYVSVKRPSIASNHSWDIPFAHGDITQPGGFRRYYMRQRAIREGRQLPTSMTNNFVDFISLYGHFAGGDYPSDEDESSDLGFDDDDEGYLEFVNEERNRRSSLHLQDGQPGHPGGAGHQHDITYKHEGTASSKKAFFLLIKSFVGTGVLFLPKSFYNGGLLFSIALMALTGYLALHCMLLLIECHSKLHMSYGDIGYHLVGSKTRNLVFFSIVISQIGFCCAYSIFVAKNTRFLFNSITNCTMDLPISFWVMAQFLFYIPMSMVRRIKNFSFLALVADVFIVVGLSYLFYYDGRVLITQGIANVEMFNPNLFPLIVGTAVFSYEGIGLVIPVVDSMKNPSEFPRVLSLTVFISAMIFILAASLSYMAFGDKVETVVLLNLTEGGSTTSFIQFLYSIAIMFSTPLQLFPAIRILESGLFTKSGKRNPMVKWQKNAFRLFACLLVAFISIIVSDQLDEFVSIIGTFACVPLSFIYPTLFHFLAIDSSRLVKIKDMCLFFIGILMMFYVTYLTLQQWGSSVPSPPQCPSIPVPFLP
ncbi:hypothetical protein BB560_003892 [Smittium megazygosporum]|uniref:Amino acid transporter transmembrane domain-containing protein n=1 Tax=Smittium megazygosporum TaxID=133381 RepID=A0A2T9ZAU8_9FUNG|nr:hypothetical protein BB560_003892 [Smittium megazygosporum]